MTKAQWKIIYILTAISLIVNSCALGVSLWSARDLEQRGISIEELLKK